MQLHTTTWVLAVALQVVGLWPGVLPGMNAEPQPFDVPYLSNIRIDGDTTDWAGRGLQILALKPVGIDAVPVASHDARFSLGWDEDGLLVAAWIKDDAWMEDTEKPWRLDGVELFLAPAVGQADVCQWIVLPGMGAEKRKAQVRFFDHRKAPELKTLVADATLSRHRIDDSTCRFECRIPWSALGLTPERGSEVGFQLWFNDADRADVKDPVHIAWFEGLRTFRLTNHMHRLRLVDRAGPPERLYPTGRLDLSRNACRFYLTGRADLAGQTVTVLDGDRALATATLDADDFGRASTFVYVPLPAFGESYGLLTVTVAERYATRVGISDYDRKREEQFAGQPFEFETYVFEGEALPAGAFRNAEAVERIIGPHTVEIHTYDAGFHRVERAAEPGRYGAIVRVKAVSGATVFRYATLFRVGAEADRSALVDKGAQVAIELAAADLPDGKGFSAAALDDLWWSELKARTGDVRSTYRYMVHLPRGYDDDEARHWPLFLYLHGGGLAGGTFERFKREGFPAYLSDGSLPYLVVVPHSHGYWNAAGIRDVVDRVRHTHRVDPERLYVLGHSLGAKGVSSFMAAYGHRVAAAVLMGGGGGNPKDHVQVPTWVINGEHEARQRKAGAERFVKALNSMGGEGRNLVVPGQGHGVETHALARPDLHQWLSQQSRRMPYSSDAPEAAPH